MTKVTASGELGAAFPRSLRLRLRREFEDVQRNGTRLQSSSFVLLFVRSVHPQIPPRMGVTVSRRVGNAVVRNRVKRLLREYFRTHRHQLENGLRMVVIARRGAATRPVSRLHQELCGLFQQAAGVHRPDDA